MANQFYIDKYKDFDKVITTYYQVKDHNGKVVNVDGVVNPLKVDNRQIYSVIDNQGSTPHCAGYSICGICEALIWKRTGKLVNLNADQVYAKAKTLDGDKDGEGTYLEAAIKAAMQLGGFDQAAKNIKTGFVYNDRTDATVKTVKYLLHKYDFLHAGFSITNGWYSCTNSNYVIHHGPQQLGGHAVVIVGYDRTGVYIANSWGTGWGAKGFGILPWSVFKQELMYCCFLQNCFDNWSEK